MNRRASPKTKRWSSPIKRLKFLFVPAALAALLCPPAAAVDITWLVTEIQRHHEEALARSGDLRADMEVVSPESRWRVTLYRKGPLFRIERMLETAELSLGAAERAALVRRSAGLGVDVRAAAREIVESVRRGGDAAESPKGDAASKSPEGEDCGREKMNLPTRSGMMQQNRMGQIFKKIGGRLVWFASLFAVSCGLTGAPTVDPALPGPVLEFPQSVTINVGTIRESEGSGSLSKNLGVSGSAKRLGTDGEFSFLIDLGGDLAAVVSEIVDDTIRGMLSSLKGYEPGKDVEIRLQAKSRSSKGRTSKRV